MDGPFRRQGTSFQHDVSRDSILSWLSRTDESENCWSVSYSPSSRSSVMSSSKASEISSSKSIATPATKVSHKPLTIVIPSRGGPNGERAPNFLSSEHLDLWEHASLLYHAYEWQAAAETFFQISLYTDDAADRAVCLLCAGLIEARLGDYELAAETLDDAAYLDDSLLIIYFVRGLVSARLGDYGVADGYFEACLDTLEHDAIEHTDIGLHFVVDRPMLQRNLKAVRFAQLDANEERNPVPPQLDGIPAEIICEPPLRGTPTSAKSPGRTPERVSMLRKIFKGTPAETSSLRHAGARSRSFSNVSHPISENSLPRPPVSPLSMYHRRQSDFTASSASMLSPTKKPTQAPLSSSAPSVAWKRYSSELRGRPRTPYVPRAARVERDTTQGLAQFIRGPEDNKAESKVSMPSLAETKQHKKVPRDAKGERDPTQELATFVKVYAPERLSRASSLMRPLVHVDPEVIPHLPLNRMFKDNGEASPCRIPQPRLRHEATPVAEPLARQMGRTLPPVPLVFAETSPMSESDGDQAMEDRQLVPAPEIARPIPFSPPPSDIKETTIEVPQGEILQPVAYRPALCQQTKLIPQPSRSSPETPSITSHPYEQQSRDIPTPPITPSSTKSFCRSLDTEARRVMAEKRALMRLEGRDVSKRPNIEDISFGSSSPVPRSRPHQRRVSTPETVHSTLNSTIDSEDFFDTVVQKHKSPKRR